jgi:hypothetical protein
MSCTVWQFMMQLEKNQCSLPVVRARAQPIHLKFPPLVIHSVITFLLNDHVCVITQPVMTSHIFSLLHVLARCRTISQREMDHTKCPLYNLPSSLLLFSKPTLFLVFSLVDCLHKFGIERIDTISEITLFGIRVAIDLICDHWSITLRKPREHRRALKHIDVTLRVCHVNERVSSNSKIL